MKSRWTGWPLGVVVALCASTAVVGDAKADPKKEGEVLNDEGRALARAGKWEEAKKKFEGAYAKVGTPGVLFNLAWAEQNLGQYRSALKHYRLYLSLPPTEKITAEARGNAQKFSAECASKLCTIEVRGATKVTVEGEGPSDVEPGTHKVEMDGPKGTRSKTVTCKPGETVSVEYEEKTDVAVVPVPTATATTTSRPPDPPPAEVGEKGSWVVPGVLGGVGVVGIGVGIGLGLAATGERAPLDGQKVPCDAAGIQCPATRDAYDSTKTLGTASIVSYAIGGAAIAGAAIATLVIQPWESKKSAGVRSVAPAVGGGMVGLMVQGGF